MSAGIGLKKKRKHATHAGEDARSEMARADNNEGLFHARGGVGFPGLKAISSITSQTLIRAMVTFPSGAKFRLNRCFLTDEGT